MISHSRTGVQVWIAVVSEPSKSKREGLEFHILHIFAYCPERLASCVRTRDAMSGMHGERLHEMRLPLAPREEQLIAQPYGHINIQAQWRPCAPFRAELTGMDASQENWDLGVPSQSRFLVCMLMSYYPC